MKFMLFLIIALLKALSWLAQTSLIGSGYHSDDSLEIVLFSEFIIFLS